MSETSWPDETTARIAAAIKDLRGDRSGQWLSDRTAQLGHRVSRSTISEIETGRRKSITVADLIILAAALDTVPLALIYPGPYREKIRVLPDLEVPQVWGVRWFQGELNTFSEVPFDEEGTLVQVASPQAYNDNLRRIQNAKRAAVVDERKQALMRELNDLRHAKTTGQRHVSDQELQFLVDAIADCRREVDYLDRYAEGVAQAAIYKQVPRTYDPPPDSQEDVDGR